MEQQASKAPVHSPYDDSLKSDEYAITLQSNSKETPARNK